MRAILQSSAAPVALLQRGVSAGGEALAAVAGGPALQADRSRQGLSVRAEPSLSAADAAPAASRGRNGRDRRVGGGEHGQCRICRMSRLSSSVRGPARSVRIQKTLLSSARLLRAVLASRDLSGAEILRLLVPLGVTSGGATGIAVARAAAASAATPLWPGSGPSFRSLS